MAMKKIGGKEYRVEPLLAYKALLLKAKIFKIAGPALGKLLEIWKATDLKKASDEEKAEASSKALGALSAVFAENEPTVVVDLIKELVELAEVKRPSGTFDQVDMDGDFQGDDQKYLMPLVAFVLQEQFSDFFSGLLGSGNQKTAPGA